MINFFWIVLISIIATIISTILLVAGLYIFYDSIHAFILRRKVPKDKTKFKDGGNINQNSDKEVKEDDRQYREYERLREESRVITGGERPTQDASSVSRQFPDKPGDITNDAGNSEPTRTDTKPAEDW